MTIANMKPGYLCLMSLFIVACSTISPDNRSAIQVESNHKDKLENDVTILLTDKAKSLEKELAQLKAGYKKLASNSKLAQDGHKKEIKELQSEILVLRQKINNQNLVQTQLNEDKSLKFTSKNEPLNLISKDNPTSVIEKDADQNQTTTSPISTARTIRIIDADKTTKKLQIYDFNDPDLEERTQIPKLKNIPGAQIEYTKAYAIYLQNNYAMAIRALNDFLINFKGDPYTISAEYWLGMSYFKLNLLSFAENHFRNILRNFSHTYSDIENKSPDSIYMLGSIAETSGLIDQSNYYYWKVIEIFPRANIANNARKKLLANSDIDK